MADFNLSAWALRNKTLVRFGMVVLALIGIWSYQRLGQSEDPPFTFKIMVVRTFWPGATAKEVGEQLTDRIEKKLMETGEYEFIRSYSRPGESLVQFMARDSMHSRDIPQLWYQVRKKVGDIRQELPSGIVGPFYNDEFGDTFGNIYALTGEGFDYATMKDYAERLVLDLHRVPDVAKVDLVGLQEEKIFIELSNTKLATLGVPLEAVQQAIDQQNAVTPTSFFETESDRVQLRVSGGFHSVDEIKNFPIRANGKTFRLADVATVRRGFADPAAPRMRFLGKNAIGIAVSMKPGGDIVALGSRLEGEFGRLQNTLPVGMKLDKVSDQPAAVRDSVAEFVETLALAVAIVLLVSFFSLGKKPGLVIAVEMMAVKMEQGMNRLAAASFAYKTTAFPMLTGTLVTAAGFLPIATAQSGTGEYTRSIFQVVTIALLLSWIAAVVFIPFLGDALLPEPGHHRAPEAGKWDLARKRIALVLPRWLAAIVEPDPPMARGAINDPYDNPFYDKLRAWIAWCVRNRAMVIVLTIV